MPLQYVRGGPGRRVSDSSLESMWNRNTRTRVNDDAETGQGVAQVEVLGKDPQFVAAGNVICYNLR